MTDKGYKTSTSLIGYDTIGEQIVWTIIFIVLFPFIVAIPIVPLFFAICKFKQKNVTVKSNSDVIFGKKIPATKNERIIIIMTGCFWLVLFFFGVYIYLYKI